jgi:hypothetical protein
VLVLQRSVDGSPVHAVWGVPRGYNRPCGAGDGLQTRPEPLG